MKNAVSLLELNNIVRRLLEIEMPETYWVKAEISTMQVAYNGHCYMELVQKDSTGGNFVAKARANVWKSTFQPLRTRFEMETGQKLSAGLNVLLEVSVSFHEQYGYALVVHNIDPTYTMGDMARRRREILARLQADGVLELNKELKIPALPQRIAVISSATAAGYGDFCNQLNENQYGFKFSVTLFSAVMQGDRAESSIISALDSIAIRAKDFDVVVIIRGGGATSDLNCFDSYMLAMNIANFPLPIITGIGHERDDTVIDMVSHTRVKTPTAAAELLIGVVLDSAAHLQQLSVRFADRIRVLMEEEKRRMTVLSQKIPSLFSILKIKQENLMDQLLIKALVAARKNIADEKYNQNRFEERLSVSAKNYMTAQKHRLELLERSVDVADPVHVLQRGYSLTICNGHVVKSVCELNPGDKLTTRFADGKIESTVTEV
ncbi:MAG: exodeoxyribonuclease VII large subunit [Bacteroidaceae bacterium]|nr:exodeoxyribonuclease VII large subunit [Bacteroidaceae bacterium]